MRVEEILNANREILKHHDIEIVNTESGIKIEIGDSNVLEILVLVYEQVTIHVRTSQYHEYNAVAIFNNSDKTEYITFSETELLSSGVDLLPRRFGLRKMQNMKTAGILYDILKMSCFTAVEIEKYDAEGWITEEGKHAFICGNQMITSDGIRPIINLAGIRQGAIRITAHDACKFIAEKYLRLFNTSKYGRIMICFCILANLQYIIKRAGKYIAFMLYIWGSTGTGKTSTVFPTLNPFELANVSLNDTVAAAMEILNQNKCSVTILDDLKSKKSNAVKILDRVSRIASDRSTSYNKVRGGKVVGVDLDNMVAVTAEVEPPLQTSSFARMLILQFDRDTVNLSILEHLERNKQEFMDYVIAFIVHFIADCATKKDWATQFCEAYEIERACQIETLKKHRLHGRYYNTIAWIMTAWKSICEFGCKYGVFIEGSEDFELELQEMVVKQHYKYTSVSPAKVFCRVLFHLIEIGRIKVYGSNCISDDDKDIISVDGIYRIKTTRVFAKVQKFCFDNEMDFNLSETSLRKELLKEGLIIFNSKQNITTFSGKEKGVSFQYMKFLVHKAKDFIKSESEDDEDENRGT